MARAGVDPLAVRSFDDFAKLPLLSKTDLFERTDEMVSESHPGRLYNAVTSGSTGTALRFKYDSVHMGWIEACMDRAHRWWGIDRADRKLSLWGRPVDGGQPLQAKAWLLHRLRNYLSFNTFEELDDVFLGHIVDQLRTFKPKLIYGYASSIGALADYMKRKG